MFPSIMNQDLITLSPWKLKSPNLGDIVAFVNPFTNQFNIHRIIQIKKNAYLIKGDYNYQADGYFTFDQITGYVSQNEGAKWYYPFSIQLKLKTGLSFLSRLNILTVLSRLLKKIL